MADVGPPAEKKIRLALENATAIPPPELNGTATTTSATGAVPFDVTETGHLVYKPPLTSRDSLTEQIHKLWAQHPNLKGLDDISDNQSNDADIAPTPGPRSTSEELGSTEADTQATKSLPELRSYLYDKLFHAKSEVEVAMDLVNVLLAGLKPPTTGTGNDPLAILGATSQTKTVGSGQGTSAPPLRLPANTIHYTYTHPTKPEPAAQIRKVKLALGAKRKHLKAAASIFNSNATSMAAVIEEEHQFWEQALQLRQKNWIIRPRHVDGVPGDGQAGQSSFSVVYGYQHVGSTFTDPGVAELVRRPAKKDTAGTSTEFVFYHPRQRRLEISLVDSVTRRVVAQSLPDVGTRTSPSPDQHQQLLKAQQAIFDEQLFQLVMREAKVFQTTNSAAEAHQIVSIPWPTVTRSPTNVTTNGVDEDSQHPGQLLLEMRLQDTTNPETGNRDTHSPAQPTTSYAGITGLYQNPEFIRLVLELRLCRQFYFVKTRPIVQHREGFRSEVRFEQISFAVPPSHLLLPPLLGEAHFISALRYMHQVLESQCRTLRQEGVPATLKYHLALEPITANTHSPSGGARHITRNAHTEWLRLWQKLAKVYPKSTKPFATSGQPLSMTALATLATNPNVPVGSILGKVDLQDIPLTWSTLVNQFPGRNSYVATFWLWLWPDRLCWVQLDQVDRVTVAVINSSSFSSLDQPDSIPTSALHLPNVDTVKPWIHTQYRQHCLRLQQNPKWRGLFTHSPSK
ncbi:hypothetical protein IWQ62_002389 [Dispira parvispora]|uniref:Mediator of RNA polymerase II transcription subunit 17 n=1 Tax=Dispira parvispora TaxID=1520584 RepID=A0A9W8AQ35_9FUNG|nr:hypothetical protein IWQ62_002389 [Dispira parvispora]